MSRTKAEGRGAANFRRSVALAQEPWLLVPFVAGASSIASLLGYFYGLFSMRAATAAVLLPGIALGAAFVLGARHLGREDLADRVLAGVFAGGLATLAYDVCRLPLVHAGLPIFKAISYFGTLVLGSTSVTAATELVGWAYHYSNGVGFAVMYVSLFARDRLATAIAWGTTLEAAMLLTPYAEVFGYTRGREFLVITLGAHVVYGIGLWGGLRLWRWGRPRAKRASLRAGFVLPALGVALVGADFHRAHADTLPQAPPPRLGRDLYATWNVLEVDRVITLWMVKRFANPAAEFALLPPFTQAPYGIPIDVPEAEIRRSGGASAAEVALDRLGLGGDHGLEELAAVATFYEIHPWSAAPPHAQGIGVDLREGGLACGREPDGRCLDGLFALLDAWYAGRRSAPP